MCFIGKAIDIHKYYLLIFVISLLKVYLKEKNVKKIMCALLAGMIFIPGLFADDGEYDMPDLEQLAQKSKVASGIDKPNKPAEGVNIPGNAQKYITECDDLKSKLKFVGRSLSKAYETNNPKEIRKQEFNVWYLKEKIAVAEKNKDFIYLIAELKKMHNEYPNSLELNNLVLKTKKEIAEYIQNANRIIELESKQRQLDEKLDKAQKIGSIIHQKERLKKMQQEYDNS